MPENAAMPGNYIYHMTQEMAWLAQQTHPMFTAASLEDEGFIHCTGDLQLLVRVANRFYAADPANYVILCIDPARVGAEIRWESADGHCFPHVYGPIETNAVASVMSFPRTDDGAFNSPDGAG